MKLPLHLPVLSNWFYVFAIGFLILIFNDVVNAQSVKIVQIVQPLNFGKVILYGLGGTITVPSDNSAATKTGDIVWKSSVTSPASFDLNMAPGKTVQMTYNKDVTLVGDHGGKVSLILTDSSPGGDGSFITGVSPTRVYLGGTLTIGQLYVTLFGKYSGIVNVNFTIIH